MENGGILDAQISASSEWSAKHSAIQGRLNFKKSEQKKGAWTALTQDADQWLQIDLASKHTRVTGVATQGRNGYCCQWVAQYKLQYSNDGANFQYYKQQGQNIEKVKCCLADIPRLLLHLAGKRSVRVTLYHY